MVRFFGLCLLLLSCASAAKSYDVIVGWNKPPYVIADGHTGFELELVRSIFAELGHTIVPIYVPFGRTPRLFNEDSNVIALTMNHFHDIAPESLTMPYVVYQNTAVSLADKSLKINSFADLTAHSVAAFQTASLVLGEDYANAVNRNPHYLELADQGRQVSLLLLGSVDVLIIDTNIFYYLRSQIPTSLQLDVDTHTLFKPTSYSAAIKDDALRQGFNRVLSQMMADGRYQALLDRFHLINLWPSSP